VSVFAALFLGHLIADFPLQANWVYRLKHRHWTGVLLHAAIHCVVTALLLPDSLVHWPMLIGLGLAHFATDWLKLRMKFRFRSVGFVLDQIVHVVVLVALGIWPCSPEITCTVAPVLLYPAVGYALLPALLMFSSVLADDLGQVASDSPSWLARNASKLLMLSQVTGFPLVAGTIIVRLGSVHVF
jgi:hypothetical protein